MLPDEGVKQQQQQQHRREQRRPGRDQRRYDIRTKGVDGVRNMEGGVTLRRPPCSVGMLLSIEKCPRSTDYRYRYHVRTAMRSYMQQHDKAVGRQGIWWPCGIWWRKGYSVLSTSNARHTTARARHYFVRSCRASRLSATSLAKAPAGLA